MGLRADRIMNKNIRALPLMAALQKPLQIALQNREPAPEKTFQVRMPKGQQLLVFVSPIDEGMGGSGEVSDGWVVVMQDITHLKAEEEARAQFIQAAAHDMRNPLGVTISSLGTLEQILGDDNPVANEVIDIAKSGVDRMQRLIDDLLNLERIQSGYEFHFDDIDFPSLLYEVAASIRPLADRKEQMLTLDISSDIANIQGDAHWLSRSILNYLSNASKYTPDKGAITLRAYLKEQKLHVEVQDSGAGIPLDLQARLFERFYRVDDRRQERGSGLGLAIVKSVVEAHRGAVYVWSREGEGSIFGLRIPVRQTVFPKYSE
jgi:signal transduction histidine kinase